MRVSRIVLVAAMLSPAAASANPGPKAPPQKAHAPVAPTSHPVTTVPTTHGNPHMTAPTAHGGAKAATTHGSSATTYGRSAKTTAPAPSASGSNTRSSTTAATSPASTTSTTTATTTTLNPIAQKISSNRGLQPKVSALLPTGMTLNQASLGFKNQGQFLAALHVSRNLGIPFADLKTAMTGVRPATTGTTGGTTAGTTGGTTTGTTTSPTTLSLGQAIHKLRPSADTVTATTTAEHQASAELSASPTTASTATTSTTTTTSKKKHGK
jgi:hypothetical protein